MKINQQFDIFDKSNYSFMTTLSQVYPGNMVAFSIYSISILTYLLFEAVLEIGKRRKKENERVIKMPR